MWQDLVNCSLALKLFFLAFFITTRALLFTNHQILFNYDPETIYEKVYEKVVLQSMFDHESYLAFDSLWHVTTRLVKKNHLFLLPISTNFSHLQFNFLIFRCIFTAQTLFTRTKYHFTTSNHLFIFILSIKFETWIYENKFTVAKLVAPTIGMQTRWIFVMKARLG